MWGDDDISSVADSGSGEAPPIPVDSPPPEHHLSFNALKGSQSKGTLRFLGSIQGVEIQILLDGGSSDNFLQPRVAQCLKLPVQPAPGFQVMVGNGHNLIAEGFIDNLKVHIQGHTLHLPVYLLLITGADLVLGAPWLATLGPHIADYNALFLKIYLGNQFVTLYGIKPKLPQPAQFHHIRRMHHTQAIIESYAVEFHTLFSLQQTMLVSQSALPPDLHSLLQQFQDVFQTPAALPPPLMQDHSIPLLTGSNPVKVRPYRYPHS